MSNNTSQILIKTKEPNPFYSQGDEDNFFYWLQKIYAVKEVNRLKKLEISVSTPIDDKSLWELIGLFTRYGLDRRELKQLCTTDNEPWFNNKKMFWYESIFGDDIC